MGQSEAHLRQTLAEEPNHIEALTALAWLLAAQGRNDEAGRAFREALDRGEGALEIAAAYARFLVSIGDNKAAEQLADDLVSPLAGSDPEGLAGSIELERSAHRFDRALALVKKAQEAGVSDDGKTRLALTRGRAAQRARPGRRGGGNPARGAQNLVALLRGAGAGSRAAARPGQDQRGGARGRKRRDRGR